MKIAYLHQYFNTTAMSGGTRSYEMARRLVEFGHQVELITTWREPVEKDDWFVSEEEGIKVHWLPVAYTNNMGFRNRMKAFLHFALAAKSRAVSTNPDIIFATSTPLTIAIPGVRAAKALNVPLVFEVRDLWPETPIATGDLRNPVLIAIAKQLEQYAYRNSQEIVALSPGMADGVARGGFSRERIHTIPNSSDIALFTAPASPITDVLPNMPDLNGKKLIVYCGTLGRVNRVSYLAKIAAAARLIDPTLVFFTIGDGAEREKITDLARSLGVLNYNFFMFPSVAKKQIPAIMHACDLSLSLVADIPAMQNNSANKFFDTLAAGRPVGINYEGWQADVLRQEGAGLVFSPEDAEVAVGQISMFLADLPNVEKTRQNALRLARERFDRDILAKQLEQVFVRARQDYSAHQ